MSMCVAGSVGPVPSARASLGGAGVCSGHTGVPTARHVLMHTVGEAGAVVPALRHSIASARKEDQEIRRRKGRLDFDMVDVRHQL